MYSYLGWTACVFSVIHIDHVLPAATNATKCAFFSSRFPTSIGIYIYSYQFYREAIDDNI